MNWTDRSAAPNRVKSAQEEKRNNSPRNIKRALKAATSSRSRKSETWGEGLQSSRDRAAVTQMAAQSAKGSMYAAPSSNRKKNFHEAAKAQDINEKMGY